MTPQSASRPQQSIPKWVGPVVIDAAILMAVLGKPSAGVPQWVAYVACAVFLLAGIAKWIGFAPGEPPKD
jgi:hypothetical protein